MCLFGGGGVLSTESSLPLGFFESSPQKAKSLWWWARTWWRCNNTNSRSNDDDGNGHDHYEVDEDDDMLSVIMMRNTLKKTDEKGNKVFNNNNESIWELFWGVKCLSGSYRSISQLHRLGILGIWHEHDCSEVREGGVYSSVLFLNAFSQSYNVRLPYETK